MQGAFCTSDQTNYWGVIVGYGEENGVLFWLVRLSFGTVIGDNGYVRILREPDNTTSSCLNILSKVTYPEI